MAATSTVREHTRKTPDGGTTKVTQHKRAGEHRVGRKSSLPRRSWDNAKKARKYLKRKKKVTAAAVLTLGLVQITSFIAFRGVALVAVSIGVVMAVVAGAMYAATSGGRLPE